MLRSTVAFAYHTDDGFTGAVDKPPIFDVEAVAFPHGRIGGMGRGLIAARRNHRDRRGVEGANCSGKDGGCVALASRERSVLPGSAYASFVDADGSDMVLPSVCCRRIADQDRPLAELRGSAGISGEISAIASPCVRDRSPNG